MGVLNEKRCNKINFGFSFDFLILDILKMSIFDFYKNTFSEKKRKSGLKHNAVNVFFYNKY